MMHMRLLMLAAFAAVFVILGSQSLAQSPPANGGRAAAISHLASELTAIQMEMRPTKTMTMSRFGKSEQGLFKSVISRAMQQLSEIQDEYKDNPYVRIDGFSIHLGFSPSITVHVSPPK